MSFVMDRATEAAANDLAEVRKLIEGMNALVNSQQQQQQQQQLLQKQQQEQAQIQQQQLQQKKQEQAQLVAQQIQLQQQQEQQQKQQQQQQQQQQQHAVQQAQQAHQTQLKSNGTSSLDNANSDPKQQTWSPQLSQQQQQQQQQKQIDSNGDGSVDYNSSQYSQQQRPATSNNVANNTANTAPVRPVIPTAGIIIEVNHLSFTRTLYFQLSPDTTIEPLVVWLKLSFQDSLISGMVLQYKGFDGLWKCLLNRDDSLKRILMQSLKNNTMLQMRVPRRQDLLSSGYTDNRLLALTARPEATIPPSQSTLVEQATPTPAEGEQQKQQYQHQSPQSQQSPQPQQSQPQQ